MADRIAFTYGEFYDFPRQVRFQLGNDWYYLSSAFDDARDDYPDFYDVFLLPFKSEEEIRANPCYWRDLSRADYLGRIPISEVGLDETRRATIDADAFGRWISRQR
jgi:hypothetical protein